MSLIGFCRACARAIGIVLHPPHLRKTLVIALVVGTWLTLFNEGDSLATGIWPSLLLIRVALNYLTPFVVANLGVLSAAGKTSVQD